MVKEKNIIAVVIALSIIAIVSPPMLWSVPLLATLFGYTRKLAFLAAAYLVYRESLYKEMYFAAYIGFFGFLMVVSYVVNHAYGSGWDNFYMNFSMAVFILYGMKKYPRYIVYGLAVMLTLWIALNTLTWREGGAYLTTNGQYGFFLGTKTSVTQYQIAAFFFADLLKMNIREKYKFVADALLAINIVSIIIYYVVQPISTSAICLALYLCFHFLTRWLSALKRNVLNVVFWGTVILNFCIVILNIQSLFENFIVNVLREDLTLNNRTFIWRVVLLACADSPIIGHGFDSDITFSINEFTSYNQSAHNQLLSWLFLGGIIGLIFMMFLIGWALHISNKAGRTTFSRIMGITFVELSFLWISEQFNTYVLFTAIMMVCFNCDKLIPLEIPKRKIRFLKKGRT